jgi:hypothetical protein
MGLILVHREFGVINLVTEYSVITQLDSMWMLTLLNEHEY